jgi:hypothetical protein
MDKERMNDIGKISLCMAVGDLLSNGKSQPTIQLAQMVQSRFNLDMKFVSKRELQTRAVEPMDNLSHPGRRATTVRGNLPIVLIYLSQELDMVVTR